MNKSDVSQTRAWHIFRGVTAWPKTIIAFGLVLIIGFASFIPTLEKDTRADAFIPPDHPALLFRDKVEDIFGLQDPMVIALVNEGDTGIFNPHSLELVEWLTRRLEAVENIDPERITSRAGTGTGR